MFLKNRVPGDAHDAPNPRRYRVPMFHVPTWLYLPWLFILGFWRLLWAAGWALYYGAKFYWATVPLGLLVYLTLAHGWYWALAASVFAAGLLLVWWVKSRGSFRRWVGWFYIGKWRHYIMYRRLWQPTVANLGLAQSFAGDRFYPSLLQVRHDGVSDLVTARMLPGQHPQDWSDAAPRFAHTFKALSCTASVSNVKAGRVALRLRLVDTLTETLAPFTVPDRVDVRRLVVAVDEDGRLFTVSLIGHVLVAGRTGSGKGSVVWSIVSALAVGISDGLVQIHAFDPKGGMEFAFGRGLFHAFHYDGPEAMAGALEDLAKTVNRRADRFRSIARDHTATVDEPSIVILIDEFASLTAYIPDKKLKERINFAMAAILTKGRAVGVYVVAALQDPRKEILSYRNLFATRIALALNEESEVNLILNDHATDRGAAAHLIGEDMPGVAYVMLDGRQSYARVRFPYHSDGDILALEAVYGHSLATQEGR